MMHLIAVVCPPLALLLARRPIAAVLAFFLCLAGLLTFGLTYVLAILIAWAGVSAQAHDRRTGEIVKELKRLR